MAISLDRKSPGVVGIILGAVGGIALGGLLAIVHLTTQAVEVVSVIPKEPAAGVRYYVKGANGTDSGRAMERKLEDLKQSGAETSFSEGDLNGWAAERFKPVKMEESEKNGPFVIIAGKPNFKMVDRELQVGMENDVSFFGNGAPLVLQARGKFERTGGGIRFAPSEAYLGGLPLHRLPGLFPVVAKRFAPETPDDLKPLLERATSIAVEEGQLVVKVR